MKLAQMFPSKFLEANDLAPGQFVEVTIVGLDYAQVQSDGSDVSVMYTLHLAEHRKPMKLNKTNAQIIADVLKLDDTDAWKGKRIRVFPTTTTYAGRTYPVIRVDINPVLTPAGPALKPGTVGASLADYAAKREVETINVTPIGEKRAGELLQALAAAGTTYAEFLLWLKSTNPGVFERCNGVEPKDLPIGIKPFKDEFLKKATNAAPSGVPASDDIPF